MPVCSHYELAATLVKPVTMRLNDNDMNVSVRPKSKRSSGMPNKVEDHDDSIGGEVPRSTGVPLLCQRYRCSAPLRTPGRRDELY
jgi:hypothetical protein